MKLKYYLKGLGAGLLVSAVAFVLIGNEGKQMTDAEVIRRAAALGMTMQGTTLSGSSSNSDSTTGNTNTGNSDDTENLYEDDSKDGARNSSEEKTLSAAFDADLTSNIVEVPKDDSLDTKEADKDAGSKTGKAQVEKTNKADANKTDLSDSEKTNKNDVEKTNKADNNKKSGSSDTKEPDLGASKDKYKNGKVEITSEKNDSLSESNTSDIKSGSKDTANKDEKKTENSSTANKTETKSADKKTENKSTENEQAKKNDIDSTDTKNQKKAGNDLTTNKSENKTDNKSTGNSKEDKTSNEIKNVSINTETVTVKVPGGSSSETVSAILEKEGVVSSAKEFDNYLVSNNLDRYVRSGLFTIKPNSSYKDVAAVICRH
ncbi:hypothetical protein [Butyrivibrio sp. NC3005]|uniref:hypothetical protein n=1 Tax=Butyrivibrio sp. NC3005 TaxID=1280685 RepID=UPI00040F12E5|nr:hypothetical protein [Butyrivibrio sp. NC3005]